MGILRDADADEVGMMRERCEYCGRAFHEVSFARDEEGNPVSSYCCGTRGCKGNHPHTLPTTANKEVNI